MFFSSGALPNEHELTLPLHVDGYLLLLCTTELLTIYPNRCIHDLQMVLPLTALLISCKLKATMLCTEPILPVLGQPLFLLSSGFPRIIVFPGESCLLMISLKYNHLSLIILVSTYSRITYYAKQVDLSH